MTRAELLKRLRDWLENLRKSRASDYDIELLEQAIQQLSE